MKLFMVFSQSYLSFCYNKSPLVTFFKQMIFALLLTQTLALDLGQNQKTLLSYVSDKVDKDIASLDLESKKGSKRCYPDWWYGDCCSQSDDCCDDDCLCEDLEGFTLSTISAQPYTTQNLNIKLPISLRFLTVSSVAAPNICNYRVSFIDLVKGKTEIYRGSSDATIGPELVDLQIGTVATDALVWTTDPVPSHTQCRRGVTCYKRNISEQIGAYSAIYYPNNLGNLPTPQQYLTVGELEFELVNNTVPCEIQFKQLELVDPVCVHDQCTCQ